MAHTTEPAVLVLSRHPPLVAGVQSTTATVVENAENRETLHLARQLARRFPVNVQRAAVARRVVFLLCKLRRSENEDDMHEDAKKCIW